MIEKATDKRGLAWFTVSEVSFVIYFHYLSLRQIQEIMVMAAAAYGRGGYSSDSQETGRGWGSEGERERKEAARDKIQPSRAPH